MVDFDRLFLVILILVDSLVHHMHVYIEIIIFKIKFESELNKKACKKNS